MNEQLQIDDFSFTPLERKPRLIPNHPVRDPNFLTGFTLHRSVKRKTVGITIERDASLILHAPIDYPLKLIEQVLREKAFWIYTKLAEKKQYAQTQKEKEFVEGEKFYYLGKSYRLQLIESNIPDDMQPALRFYQGRFMLKRDETLRAKQHFIKWYTERGEAWIRRKVDEFANRLSIAPPPIRVQDLGFRWGSCSRNGFLNFHWRVILLPPKIIEYVIAHELVHLFEPLHNIEFGKRLEQIMPDFATRKQWLNQNGIRFCS